MTLLEQAVLNKICRRFLEEYIPDKNLAVDETMVPIKGRLSIKQYHKDKPTKWESRSGPVVTLRPATF